MKQISLRLRRWVRRVRQMLKGWRALKAEVSELRELNSGLHNVLTAVLPEYERALKNANRKPSDQEANEAGQPRVEPEAQDTSKMTMTIKAIPHIIRAMESMRQEHAMMQHKIDSLTATLVSVADGRTSPEALYAFRTQRQLELRLIENQEDQDDAKPDAD